MSDGKGFSMSEWNLYLLLARMLGETGLEESVLRANDQNCWPDLLSLSSNHLVTTQLYWILKSTPSVWQQINQEYQEYLQHIFELNGSRNVQLLDETKEIVSVLNQQKITPLLLKGTGLLLSEECPHIGYRMQLDIDFLVRPEGLEKAATAIKRMGYFYAEEAQGSLEIVTEQRLPRLLSIYKNHKHLPPLLSPDKRVLVELHRHPYSKRFQKHFPVFDLFERAKIKKINGLNWFEMSAKDQEHLLLTEGYIDAGFKRAFQLPLRLGRDYLDIKTLLPSENNEMGIELDRNFAKNQLFPKELIETILTPSEQLVSNVKVNGYIRSMERVMDNDSVYKFIELYSNFLRRTVNLLHNPGLIRKLF